MAVINRTLFPKYVVVKIKLFYYYNLILTYFLRTVTISRVHILKAICKQDLLHFYSKIKHLTKKMKSHTHLFHTSRRIMKYTFITFKFLGILLI